MSRLHAGAARLAASLVAAPPAMLLGAACGLQLVLGVTIAAYSTHNHFVWYSGGDATEYWTSSWSLSHGGIPQAYISYAVPILWSWVPLVTGATMLSGLPVITIAQLVVFVPLCAVLVWAIGDLLFGRLFAWWSLALWIVAPFLLLWGFRSDYAGEFRDLFLGPHWFGLTNMADLPSLVAVLGATWASLRLLESRVPADGLLAGALTGIAIGVKPANGFYVPAVVVLVAATRTPRAVLAFGGGIAVPLVTLTLWKAKGRGSIPILADGHTREALGSHPALAAANDYVQFDWTHFQHTLSDLHEVFWSVRVLEFLAVAGLLGALRRSPLKGAFLGLWFAGFCIVKGSSSLASIPALNYWRYVEPGLPAFVFLAASVVYLVPRAGRQYRAPHVPRALPGGPRTVAGALVLLVAVPLAVVAVTPAASSALYARDNALGNEAPISNGLRLTRAEASNGVVRLAWRPSGTAGTRVYYVVYRSSSPATCSLPDAGGKECVLNMDSIALTRDPTYVDRPGSGRHWYRVGLLANFRDRTDGSDLMLVGPVRAAGQTAR